MNNYNELIREMRDEATRNREVDSNVKARLLAGASAIEGLVIIIFSLLDERVKS